MSQTQDSDSEFPARSLLGAELVPPELGGGLLLTCDCGATIHLVVEAEPGTHEIALTCNCHTVRWITVTVPGAPDD